MSIAAGRLRHRIKIQKKRREPVNDGEIDPRWGYGYLPRSVTALLYPLRDPALGRCYGTISRTLAASNRFAKERKNTRCPNRRNCGQVGYVQNRLGAC